MAQLPVTEINHVADYAVKRREAYPSVEDQLDALWKGGTDAADMKARVEAVKQRFPKPGQQAGNPPGKGGGKNG